MKRYPGNISSDDFNLHFFYGSVTLDELFQPGVKITSFEVLKKKIDIRYDSKGEPAYDNYYDIGSFSEDSLVKTIRVKGSVPTSFGKRTFDVLITCNADMDKSLNDIILNINSKIDSLVNLFKSDVLENS